jgi:hypothetical protein
MYDRGATRAAAVALVVLIVTELLPGRTAARPPARLARDPETAERTAPALPPRFGDPVAWLMGGVLLAAVGWLLLSALASR